VSAAAQAEPSEHADHPAYLPAAPLQLRHRFNSQATHTFETPVLSILPSWFNAHKTSAELCSSG